MSIKPCVECGRDFESGKGNTKSCAECRTTHCVECGKTLLTSPWRKRQNRDTYCSQACQFAFNRVRIDGDVAYLELTTKMREFVAETAIDLADLDWLRNAGHRWFAKPLTDPVDHGQYAACADMDRKRVYLSRFLLDAPANMQVDHIDGDTLNNRRSCNLRLVTGAQNVQNVHGAVNGPIRGSKSGVRGVSYDGKSGKWRARVGVNYKQVDLGLFKTVEEAETVVVKARRKLMTHSEI